MPNNLQSLRREVTLAENQKELARILSRVLLEANDIKAIFKQNQAELSRIKALPRGPKGDKGDKGEPGTTPKVRDGIDGLPGKPGKTPVKGKDYWTKADKEELVAWVFSRIKQPKNGEDAVVDVPAIAKETAKYIIDNELISTENVKGLRNEISSYRHQMAMRQAGQSGGGMTLTEGTNITLTPLPDGTVRIDASGGGAGVTVETPTGVVDASNTTFGVSAEPKWIVADGITYFKGVGYTYTSPNVILDLAPSNFIRAII